MNLKLNSVFTKITFLIVSIFIFHVFFVITFGLTSKPKKSDAIIVFGNTVNTDGTVSKRLETRLNK